ncbi:hypothetical protein AYO39_00465 [Actinobacteria bacterium SCGC AG-212-D09]|nr:hypothetical protein AYO39_00465 [Actinobacteria bacterium SCGC AG-212-D09]
MSPGPGHGPGGGDGPAVSVPQEMIAPAPPDASEAQQIDVPEAPPGPDDSAPGEPDRGGENASRPDTIDVPEAAAEPPEATPEHPDQPPASTPAQIDVPAPTDRDATQDTRPADPPEPPTATNEPIEAPGPSANGGGGEQEQPDRADEDEAEQADRGDAVPDEDREPVAEDHPPEHDEEPPAPGDHAQGDEHPAKPADRVGPSPGKTAAQADERGIVDAELDAARAAVRDALVAGLPGGITGLIRDVAHAVVPEIPRAEEGSDPEPIAKLPPSVVTQVSQLLGRQVQDATDNDFLASVTRRAVEAALPLSPFLPLLHTEEQFRHLARGEVVPPMTEVDRAIVTNPERALEDLGHMLSTEHMVEMAVNPGGIISAALALGSAVASGDPDVAGTRFVDLLVAVAPLVSEARGAMAAERPAPEAELNRGGAPPPDVPAVDADAAKVGDEPAVDADAAKVGDEPAVDADQAKGSDGPDPAVQPAEAKNDNAVQPTPANDNVLPDRDVPPANDTSPREYAATATDDVRESTRIGGENRGEGIRDRDAARWSDRGTDRPVASRGGRGPTPTTPANPAPAIGGDPPEPAPTDEVGPEPADDDADLDYWEREYGEDPENTEPRRERISDANKAELEDSGWLRRELPDAARRRAFMKWLETSHRQGYEHEHLRPGSPAARDAIRRFNEEEPP